MRRTFVALYLENIQLQYLNCMSCGLNLAIFNCIIILLIRDCFGIFQKVAVFFSIPKREVMIQSLKNLISCTYEKNI